MDSEQSMNIIALDVGGTKIAAAAVTYELDQVMPSGIPLLAASEPVVSAYCAVPTNAPSGGEAVLEAVVGQVRAVLDELPGPLAGIGVGAAGVIDPVNGNVAFANEIMPGWTGQPLKQRLVREFGVPVAAIGDVHAHAVGEARWGAARGAHSCLCIGVGTGLGGAYVLEGTVLRGFHGAAGHVGHTLHPAAADILCSCGSMAHAETVTSGTAIAARFQGRAIGEELDPARMGDVVSARADAGDAEALAILQWAGRNLGEALGGWCNVLDPQMVVVSGTVVNAGEPWWSAAQEGFEAPVMPPLADIPLVRGQLGSHAPLVGAAESVIDELVHTQKLARVHV